MSRWPRRPLLALAGLGGALLLAGCGGGDEDLGPRQYCPLPGIINGLDSDSVYRGGAADGPVAELAYMVSLQDITGGCVYDEAGLEVNLGIDVVVEPGPAFAGSAVSVPWFVAVADADGAIIDKVPFTSEIAVAPGAPRAGNRETIQQRFPGLDAKAGGAYRLYLGLQMDRDKAMKKRATLP
ncbi:MAG: hypothetical protein U1E14_10595 [Geminicoccaceae bacterium]